CILPVVISLVFATIQHDHPHRPARKRMIIPVVGKAQTVRQISGKRSSDFMVALHKKKRDLFGKSIHAGLKELLDQLFFAGDIIKYIAIEHYHFKVLLIAGVAKTVKKLGNSLVSFMIIIENNHLEFLISFRRSGK